MKTVITFKAIDAYTRRIVHRNIPIEHNFKIIPSREWQGLRLPETSVEEQVIEYLDTIDKSELMDREDFSMILDYYPKRPRARKNEMREFLNFCKPYFKAYPNLQTDIMAVIAKNKHLLFKKRKSNEEKMREVLSLYITALEARSSFVDEVLENLTNKTLGTKILGNTLLLKPENENQITQKT